MDIMFDLIRIPIKINRSSMFFSHFIEMVIFHSENLEILVRKKNYCDSMKLIRCREDGSG